MFPQKRQIIGEIDSETYTLGQKIERDADAAMSLVSLSHTPLERRLYAAMLTSRAIAENGETFTARRLMEITGITSLSTIRRGLEGLVSKLSVERAAARTSNGGRDHSVAYSVVAPPDVIARRDEEGIATYGNGVDRAVPNRSLERVVQRVLERNNLSPREEQVALCCAEGLTNAEIGLRLMVSEQTVKFHLRNIYVKFGVRRRAELISRLLM